MCCYSIYLKHFFLELKCIILLMGVPCRSIQNKNNFINLCYHKYDYNLECEWNFFETSHGKSACDGIGDTVKRLLTGQASLQRPIQRPIHQPHTNYRCYNGILLQKYTRYYITPADIQQYDVILQERFGQAKPIKGTQQFHHFVPISQSNIKAYKLSKQCDPPQVVSYRW